MSSTCESFLKAMAISQPRNKELGIASVWWHKTFNDANGMSISEIVHAIELAGYAKQNRSRLYKQLREDKRTRKVGADNFDISVRYSDDLDKEYERYLKVPIPKQSDSVLPTDLFSHTRIYIERVVKQINASYDYGLYDCSAVMCRRLLETLVIEVYERQVRSEALKDGNGHFKMFSGLMEVLENDTVINVGREAMKGLKEFKKLGDRSAHNRRYNARKEDIDRVRDTIRIASEELIHIAFPLKAE